MHSFQLILFLSQKMKKIGRFQWQTDAYFLYVTEKKRHKFGLISRIDLSKFLN